MATSTLGFIMSATKRGAEDDPEGGPASKLSRSSQPQSFKNIFKQLSLLQPGLFFEMEPDPEATVDKEGNPSSFHMVVDVDGVKFTGKGPSKRNAKVNAAEQVLAHLQNLGVKAKEPEEKPPMKPAEIIINAEMEAEATYEPMTEERKALQMSGKNPVMMLHEIRPDFDSEIESDERRGAHHRKVVISVTVEGNKYLGSGRSNKNARARAAVAALTSMFGLEFTEFGENEIPVYLGEDWNWRKFTKRAEKTTGTSSVKEDNAVKPVKNAVMQLNDMYKGLEFSVIERSGPDHCPFFRVSVEIEGQTYEGEGSTKKAAKLDAAEHVLEGLGESGVLANRAPAKKQQQQNWLKKAGLSWDSKGNFIDPNENGSMGGGYGRGGGGGGNYWDRDQDGMRERGRGGRGRGGRGGGGMYDGGPPMRGGAMRGRGGPWGRASWGSGEDTTSSGYNSSGYSSSRSRGGMGRGRGGSSSMMPPPSSPPSPRGGRGWGTRGSATHLATVTMPASSWGLGSSTSSASADYSSYQDPYTSSTSAWKSATYGYDSKPYSYDKSYGYESKSSFGFDKPYVTKSPSYTDKKSYTDNSYITSYDTSYSKTYGGGGSNSYLEDSSFSKVYQAGAAAASTAASATGSWGDYYGY